MSLSLFSREKLCEQQRPIRGRSLWLESWHRLARNRVATAGLIVLCLLSGLCVVGPWIAPYSFEEQNLTLGAAPPSRTHWLGTDVLGRDLFTRLLYGGRVSFSVGILATLVSLSIGVTYGSISGYVGGRLDRVMMRIVDVLYALPFSVFVVVLTVVFGSNFVLLFVAIGAVEWLTMARIVRGQVLALKEQPYVRAARVLGFSSFRILVRHIIPNGIGPVIVYTTLTVPRVMLLEAFLSFLGLGIRPPRSSWGLLIRNGAEVLDSYPWLLVFPGLILSATLFSLNFLGDGLRDALDPRMASRC
ncbi:MAG: ABC transporter permease [Kiritimatiellia bacterium]